ncbi:hypothetical protein DPMN_116246 [Dreissena polymorpha]|uniref:Uncharacterized protein n=1 Tax=Dreissena polymorpha TaxID=45954 RepID=A0A9D4KP27_DREPO|nr:hypothetical protein DPMN_116246 [Dreissena polymorpha]
MLSAARIIFSISRKGERHDPSQTNLGPREKSDKRSPGLGKKTGMFRFVNSDRRTNSSSTQEA